jgi:ABC-type transport system involved in cytochrome c biogenesis permease subunit
VVFVLPAAGGDDDLCASPLSLGDGLRHTDGDSFYLYQHSETRNPFAPHVIVYMFAYALLGVAVLMAIYIQWKKQDDMSGCDDLVRLSFSFLTIGMIFGALWAKEAWGNYWAWDPKETWAAITWFTYLVYIHYRRLPSSSPRTCMILLIIAFVFLQVCWWGINYLPSAENMSMHTYNMN